MKSKRIGDGGYTLYEDGRVWSHKTMKYLAYAWYPQGYPKIKLSVNNISKRYFLHRLLAQAFIDNPDNKPFVLHKDDNPKNWKLDNLYWGTYEDNVRDCWDVNKKLKRTTHTFLTDTGEQVTTDCISRWCKERGMPANVVGRAVGQVKRGVAVDTSPHGVDRWGNRKG